MTRVHMQIWAKDPQSATRQPLDWFYQVDGSVPEVWWLRQLPRTRDPSFHWQENLSIEPPFFTQYYRDREAWNWRLDAWDFWDQGRLVVERRACTDGKASGGVELA